MLKQTNQLNEQTKRILAVVPNEFHGAVKAYAEQNRITIAELIIASVQLVIERGYPIQAITNRELRVLTDER